MGRVIIAGSINMDVVAQAERHPRPGETVMGQDLSFIPGGKGSNQAVAAGRLSDVVSLVGRLGRDAFGDALWRFLQGENLDLSQVSFIEDVPTGTALIVVNAQSENTIVVVPGSNARLAPADVESVSFQPGDFAAAPFEIPQETILRMFQRARNADARTVLNPAPAAPFIDGLLALTDYLVVNETELAYFIGDEPVTDDLEAVRAQMKTLRHAPGQVVIVTLGARGAVVLHGEEFIHVPGRHVDAVDTTGAGDCFVGALTVALAEGQSLRDALNFANAAAALSVGKLGASASMPYRADVASQV